jgi:hypothetical protein
MREFVAILAASLLLAMPALAAPVGPIELLAPGSAYNRAAATPAAEIPALCASIIANQNKDKVAMADAGRLLFHGELMGQHCVPLDEVRGIILSQRSGDTFQYVTYVRLLRGQAAGGDRTAKSALVKLHLKP